MKKITYIATLVAIFMLPVAAFAQIAGEVVASLSTEQIDTIFNGLILVVGVFIPALGAKLAHIKMVKDQLLDVIKTHDSANESFVDVAKENRKNLAAKAIEMTIDNSPKIQKFLKYNPLAKLALSIFSR